MSKASVPELRFPEFEGRWESHRCAKIGKFTKGTGVSKADLSGTGNIPAIRYGELYTRYGANITNVFSRIECSEGLKISQGNEVLIPSSGETAYDIATASALTIKGVVLGGDINILRTENDVHFIAASIRGVRKLDIAKLAQGISVSHVYSSDIATLEFKIPTLPEQKKIAAFLSAVDEKLAAIEAQMAGWRDYKRGMMQALFTQSLRFKADDGSEFPDWKKVELGKMLDYEQPTKYLVSSTDYDAGFKTPVLTAGKSFILGYTDEVDGIYEKGPIIIFDDFTTASKFVDFRFKAKSSAMKMLSAKEGNNIKFLYEAMQMIRYPLGEHKRHWISEFAIYPINVPSLPEQQKIADALSAIDMKIEALTHRLNATREFKRGLLQKMFV